MKTSSRNQLHGTVVHIVTGAINDEIELELAGGTRIVAVITHRSTLAMDLKTGDSAIALIKAPWIILATDLDDVLISARNALSGTVLSLQAGAVNAEVRVQLAKGDVLTAIITNDSVQELGLHQGSTVTALFKASHVILAVPKPATN